MGLFEDIKSGIDDLKKDLENAINHVENDNKPKPKDKWQWLQDNGPVLAAATAGVLILLLIIGKAI